MKGTVLITGASRGIGAAAARLFAQEGYHVAVNYCRSRERAEALVRDLQNSHFSAQAFQADVSDRAQVERMVGEAANAFGGIDVLVNNCGVAQQKLFTDLTEEEWDRMFAVNMKSMFHCCQCVLPFMLRRRCGAIVNLSSIWGLAGASCEVHYSASKAAVIGFTKALAKEVGLNGITVNCVAPGVVDTEMNANLSEDDLEALKEETPLARIGLAEEIAQAILFLAGEKARFITGQVLSPNGGIVI